MTLFDCGISRHASSSASVSTSVDSSSASESPTDDVIKFLWLCKCDQPPKSYTASYAYALHCGMARLDIDACDEQFTLLCPSVDLDAETDLECSEEAVASKYACMQTA